MPGFETALGLAPFEARGEDDLPRGDEGGVFVATTADGHGCVAVAVVGEMASGVGDVKDAVEAVRAPDVIVDAEFTDEDEDEPAAIVLATATASSALALTRSNSVLNPTPLPYPLSLPLTTPVFVLPPDRRRLGLSLSLLTNGFLVPPPDGPNSMSLTSQPLPSCMPKAIKFPVPPFAEEAETLDSSTLIEVGTANERVRRLNSEDTRGADGPRALNRWC